MFIHLLKGIFFDIFAVIFLIFAFMNNPFRFSDKPIVSKLTHSIFTFSVVFTIIIVFVLIMYTKILTILNLNDIVSLSIPFFIVLVLSLTILIIIYIHTEKYNNSEKYSSPPTYMLNRKYRILLHTTSLLFTFINLYIFSSYFTKNNDVNFSFLNKMLTSNLKINKAKPLIVSFFVINILLHIIIILQQIIYKPCQINLPNSWNF